MNLEEILFRILLPMEPANRSFNPAPPSPELEELGWRIKKNRCDLGMSRTELAARLDLDAHQLGKIERGRRDPSTLLLCRIAAIFGTDLECLLRGIPSPEGLPHEAPAPEPPMASPLEIRQIAPEEIKRFRQRHGLTQHQLGRLCGVSQSAVVRWESLAGVASDSTAILLQELLDGTRNLTPLTAAEERLLNEIVARGNFRSREAFLNACLIELLKEREIAAAFRSGPSPAGLS